MLADLPRHCAVGTKRNAKGYKTSWIGHKLHLDVADGDIPVSCVLTEPAPRTRSDEVMAKGRRDNQATQAVASGVYSGAHGRTGASEQSRRGRPS